ncbi:MAG: hypothetical protein HRT74_12825 [Flavobacteriales bacterium]|nr:hypothetical protein [Flavobacteriales bacterium]
MKQLNTHHIYLSRAVFTALFVFSALQLLSNSLSGDTIIIDNTYLFVERQLRKDTLPEMEAPNQRKTSSDDWIIGGFFSTGLTNSSTTLENYQSINEFVGKASRNSMNFGAGLRFERKLSDEVFLFTEPSWERSTWKNQGIDMNAIDDSLFFFSSFEIDELLQITRQRFEIGGEQVIETDTINMSLSDNDLEINTLIIPIGIRYQQPYYHRKAKWTWDAGLSIAYYHVLSNNFPSMTWINDEGNEAAAIYDIELKSGCVNRMSEFVAILKLNRNTTLTLRYQGETPIQGLDLNYQGGEVLWNAWSNRLKIGVNIFF